MPLSVSYIKSRRAYSLCVAKLPHLAISHEFCRIMEREKQLSILYQKQGRATQFSSKAARDRWLQKEIDEYERVLSSNMAQVTFTILYS